MAPAPQLLGVGAGEHVDDVIQPHAEVRGLLQPVDAGEEFLRGERAVKGLARGETVIAIAAIRLGKGLAEVLEQRGAAAAGAFRIVDHLPELRARDLALLLVGLSPR